MREAIMLGKSAQKGSEAATLDYALGLKRLARTGRDRRVPRLLYGRRRDFEKILGRGPTALRALSFIIGFMEALDDEQALLEALAFLIVAYPGIPLSELCFLIVRHREPAPWGASADDPQWRTGIHILIAPVHSPTGLALPSSYYLVDQTRLELWCELRNLEAPYSSPKDPCRVRWGNQARKQPPEERRRGLRKIKEITTLVSAARRKGEIADGDGAGLIDYLTGQGFPDTIPVRDLRGKTGLAVVLPDFTEPIGLFGPLYQRNYPDLKPSNYVPNLSRKSDGYLPREALFPGGYLRRDTATRDLLRSELDRAVAKRAAENLAYFDCTNSRLGPPAIRRDETHGWRCVVDGVAGGCLVESHGFPNVLGDERGGECRSTRAGVGGECPTPVQTGGTEQGSQGGGTKNPRTPERMGGSGPRSAPRSEQPLNPRTFPTHFGAPSPLTGQTSAAAESTSSPFSITAALPQSAQVDDSDQPPTLHRDKIYALITAILSSSFFTASAEKFGIGTLRTHLVGAVARIVGVVARVVRAIVLSAGGQVACYLDQRECRAREYRERLAQIAEASGANVCDFAAIRGLGADLDRKAGSFARGPDSDPGKTRPLELSARGIQRLKAAASYRRAMRSAGGGVWLVPSVLSPKPPVAPLATASVSVARAQSRPPTGITMEL